MTAFAKIFEAANGQVLFTSDFIDDDDETPWAITARCSDRNGITPAYSFKYETEEQRDEQFARFDQSDAMRIEGQLHGMIERMLA